MTGEHDADRRPDSVARDRVSALALRLLGSAGSQRTALVGRSTAGGSVPGGIRRGPGLAASDAGIRGSQPQHHGGCQRLSGAAQRAWLRLAAALAARTRLTDARRASAPAAGAGLVVASVFFHEADDQSGDVL